MTNFKFRTCVFRDITQSGECDKTFLCFLAHFDFKGKASWTRGGIRQRVRPHLPHATHFAPNRRQLQVPRCPPCDGGAQIAVLGMRRVRGQNKCVWMTVNGRSAVCLSSLQPFPSSSTVGCAGLPAPRHAMEEKEMLDGRCILPLEPQCRSAVRRRTGSRLSSSALPQEEDSSEEDRPFLPRFLLQEIIFAHSPYNRQHLQGNPLCRSGWLRLRGFSETECMILPVQELAALPRCSVCEQLKAEERSLARWSCPSRRFSTILGGSRTQRLGLGAWAE